MMLSKTGTLEEERAGREPCFWESRSCQRRRTTKGWQDAEARYWCCYALYRADAAFLNTSLRPPIAHDRTAHILPHPVLHARSMSAPQSVSTFGKKKTATAVAHAKEGKGLIRVNGQPISLVEPQILRWKVYEPVLVVGEDKFS